MKVWEIKKQYTKPQESLMFKLINLLNNKSPRPKTNFNRSWKQEMNLLHRVNSHNLSINKLLMSNQDFHKIKKAKLIIIYSTSSLLKIILTPNLITLEIATYMLLMELSKVWDNNQFNSNTKLLLVPSKLSLLISLHLLVLQVMMD